MFKYIFSVLALFFFFQGNLQAQNHSRDTLFLATAKKNASALYDKAMDIQSGIYSGHEYVEPRQTNSQHPFFISEDWQWGSVIYNGDKYEQIPLLYDIVSDHLVTELFNGQSIVLVSVKVKSFTIESNSFERIDNETVNNSLPSTGYFQVIYPGNSKVIAKKFKRLEERIEGNQLEINFDEKKRFYILKDGKYVRIKNKSSILKILHDEKPGLRSFINKENIRVSKNNPEQAFASIASYYDTLKINQ